MGTKALYISTAKESSQGELKHEVGYKTEWNKEDFGFFFMIRILKHIFLLVEIMLLEGEGLSEGVNLKQVGILWPKQKRLGLEMGLGASSFLTGGKKRKMVQRQEGLHPEGSTGLITSVWLFLHSPYLVHWTFSNWIIVGLFFHFIAV